MNTFSSTKSSGVFKDISLVEVLWQNRGACTFIKIEIQQNQGLTSLGSKLLDSINIEGIKPVHSILNFNIGFAQEILESSR